MIPVNEQKTPNIDIINSTSQAKNTDTTIYINDIITLAKITLFLILSANNYIILYLIGKKINGYAIITTKLYIINNIFGQMKSQQSLYVFIILSDIALLNVTAPVIPVTTYIVEAIAITMPLAVFNIFLLMIFGPINSYYKGGNELCIKYIVQKTDKYIKKFNIVPFVSSVPKAEIPYGISEHNDLFLRPIKKYTQIVIPVITIANVEYEAILPKPVNYFNIVNGNSITPIIILTIHVLLTSNLQIFFKNYVIPFEPITTYAVITPNVLI